MKTHQFHNILFPVFFFFFPAVVFADASLILQDHIDHYPLGPYLSLYEDKNGYMTFEEISNPEFAHQFMPNTETTPNFGYSQSAIWVRFDVVNPLPRPQSLLLEVSDPQIDTIHLYLPQAPQEYVEKKGGDAYPFGMREIHHQYSVFPIDIHAQHSQTIYLRFQTSGAVRIPLTLWQPSAFAAKDHHEQYVLGVFYGVMAIMAFYNLFILFSVKDIAYLYYVAYVGFITINHLTLDGLSFEYVWPNIPEMQKLGNLFVCFALCFATLFCKQFLDTPRHLPRMNRILSMYAGSVAFVGLLSLLVHQVMVARLTALAAALGSALLVTAGILCWRLQARTARYYLAAWIVLLSGTVLFVGSQAGILPSVFLTEYAVHIGAALEVLLLSFGLADRINTMRQEKFFAQQEALQRAKQYRTLIDNLNLGVYRNTGGPHGKFLQVNPAFLQIFGYDSPEEFMNMSVSAFYENPEERRQFLSIIQQQGYCKDFEVRLRKKDGTSIWASVNATIQYDDQGKLRWMDGIVEDITARKATEETLRKLNLTFERFVPKQFLSRIAPEGIENIEFGKAKSEFITVLFSDIRSFTTLSEKMSPQELLNFLNSYLTRMDKPIHANHGFIDKFIGDAIMALFDRTATPDPDETGETVHAMEAVHAAIAMQQELEVYNQHRSHCDYPPIAIGIGIHSGPVVIGTVGSEDRMDSTVLGDVVNVASRLEGLTKPYGARIIVSEDTLQLLGKPDEFMYRELDLLRVKGRREPITIYEIFNNDPPEIRDLKKQSGRFIARGLVFRYSQQWNETIQAFQQGLDTYPDDKAIQRHLETCQKLQKQSFSADWDGVVDMEYK